MPMWSVPSIPKSAGSESAVAILGLLDTKPILERRRIPALKVAAMQRHGYAALHRRIS
jgi:hypothetical protein